ncbi:ArsR/SmtB family transcription factor [Zavarzinia sp.]|uniref:ArsR/SmtB family transcription factor n=1 Tax=Zavarzinia sp. TaxID=2027920 RepID=UPI003561DE07
MVKSSAALDLLYSALADPSRRAMVQRLAKGPATVSELASPLAISLPAVTKHLAVLEASGLVASAKTGRVRTCRIDPARLAEAQVWLAEQRSVWEARFDRLDQFLLNGEDSDERQ